ncbi:MAG TPA: tetratricopeptide repeat protein, partial [Polyangia bacterium]|nr:tetratricopeptide repeat protein [Polyangia bacterium]
MISKKEKSLVAAQKLIERGQLDKALAEFAKVVADDPKDTRTWLKMAELHAKLGTNAEAAAIYVRTGELYTEQGLSQKAVAVYKNALKLAPGDGKAYLKLGGLYKQTGLGSDAVQQFEQAAAAFTKDGVPAEAAAALRQAVAVDSENAVLRVKLAEAASLAGLVEEAVREFGRAAEQLKAQGRLDEALRVLERLLFHQPENTTRAREVAEAYITRGSPRLALPKLQSCLKADPREPRTLFLLARALEQLGQKEKAVSVLKELARLYQDLGRWNEREAAIARALAMAPADAELRAMAAVRDAASDTGVDVTPPPIRNLDAPPAPVDRFDSGGARGAGPVAVPLGVGETSARLVSTVGEAEGGSAAPPDVARILAESDVFVKYGMLERAADHLARVFELEPENREARDMLIAVFQQLG